MNLPYAMKMTGFSQVALLPILIARFNEAARARKTEKEREREKGIGIGIQSGTRTIRRKRLASRYPARRLRKNWSISRHPAKVHHVAFPRSSVFISIGSLLCAVVLI